MNPRRDTQLDTFGRLTGANNDAGHFEGRFSARDADIERVRARGEAFESEDAVITGSHLTIAGIVANGLGMFEDSSFIRKGPNLEDLVIGLMRPPFNIDIER